MNAIILISILGVVTMMSDIFHFKKAIWYIIVLSLAGAILINFSQWGKPELYYEMLYLDNFAIVFSNLIIFLVFIWFFISREEYESGEFNAGDNYALVLFATVGALLLTSYLDLSLLFLGIEILSIPLYILAGSRKHDLNSNEASLKYFIMGSFATGILLFGITLIYGATGSFKLDTIAQYASANSTNLPLMFYTGVLLIMIGLGFKVSAVPFHFWTPDVYQGAPMFITAFMATIVKAAAFAGFYRLFSTSFSDIQGTWSVILTVLIALTILIGNLLAVYQTSVKRMLAYSGISQAGYLMLTILVLNQDTKTALLLYLASYALSTMAAFTVLYQVVKIKGNDSFDSFASLGKTNPFLAVVMTVSMLSLAGIPPTVGFFAKFYLFAAVLKSNPMNIWIIGLAVLGSLISVYYYFRVIISMYGSKTLESPSAVKLNFTYQAVLILVTGLIILLGLAPGFIININNL